MFHKQNDRFKVFYIENLFAPFVRELDAKVLVMTMPDLEQYHIKRSIYSVNHLYVFHAIVSTHMVYRKGAFDYYDTIFCVGSHHYEEIRKTEQIYNLKPKTLVKAGYPRLERIYNKHQEYLNTGSFSKKDGKIILIAPSWGDKNIIESYSEALITQLLSLDGEYKIVLRPHPQFLKTRRDHITALKEKYMNNKNIIIETDLVSDINIHMADMLITDWSGIAFEYAFGTERPVLFINTPRKIYNPEYEKLEIEPLIEKLRNTIGKAVSVNELDSVKNVLLTLIKEKDKYRKSIIKCRDTFLFNWGKSSDICADFIINNCCKDQD